MKILNEKRKNVLYIGHALVIWAGASWQLIHIFTHQSARDLTLFWVVCLVMSELLALPRAIGSRYFVWGACHVVSLVLLLGLLAGVILY